MKKLSSLIKGFLVKQAIRKAERLYKRTRYHHLVINWKGCPKVIARKTIKQMIKTKLFQKHITVESFERSAIYKTY
jgi:hypothetical protein